MAVAGPRPLPASAGLDLTSRRQPPGMAQTQRAVVDGDEAPAPLGDSEVLCFDPQTGVARSVASLSCVPETRHAIGLDPAGTALFAVCGKQPARQLCRVTLADGSIRAMPGPEGDGADANVAFLVALSPDEVVVGTREAVWRYDFAAGTRRELLTM